MNNPELEKLLSEIGRGVFSIRSIELLALGGFLPNGAHLQDEAEFNPSETDFGRFEGRVRPLQRFKDFVAGIGGEQVQQEMLIRSDPLAVNIQYSELVRLIRPEDALPLHMLTALLWEVRPMVSYPLMGNISPVSIDHIVQVHKDRVSCPLVTHTGDNLLPVLVGGSVLICRVNATQSEVAKYWTFQHPPVEDVVFQKGFNLVTRFAAKQT